MSKVILNVKNLVKSFPKKETLLFRPSSFFNAVDDISFSIKTGESFGLLGESGSGKTTTGKLILRLFKPDSGKIFFDIKGNYTDITSEHSKELKAFRRQAQMISQDPYESLNPRLTVFDIVSEPLLVHRIGNSGSRMDSVCKSLEDVGIYPPERYLYRYPHELSGGQRQRISIARAIILNPSFILADEPTSMLDVSVRAGIINLLAELQENLKISMLFITHDFAVSRYICGRLAVMYSGKILEMGKTEEIIKNPLHPYTKDLLIASPDINKNIDSAPFEIVHEKKKTAGGCPYFRECTISEPYCGKYPPPKLKEAGCGRFAACHKINGRT
jgi:peptide/nickel transport system ATP-binding protein